MTKTVANFIWDTSANIRDCVKIGRMTKSLEDVMFIVGNLENGIGEPVRQCLDERRR